MLVSVLPFRRTRCKSQVMTDLTALLRDGTGLLATAWCCPGGDIPASPQDSKTLPTEVVQKNWELLGTCVKEEDL